MSFYVRTPPSRVAAALSAYRAASFGLEGKTPAQAVAILRRRLNPINRGPVTALPTLTLAAAHYSRTRSALTLKSFV